LIDREKPTSDQCVTVPGAENRPEWSCWTRICCRLEVCLIPVRRVCTRSWSLGPICCCCSAALDPAGMAFL